MSASMGNQPPMAELGGANVPYEHLPLPPPLPLSGWPVFRLLGFVFLLREQAASKAINPCLPAPRRVWGQEKGWGSEDVSEPLPGAGTAVVSGGSSGFGRQK